MFSDWLTITFIPQKPLAHEQSQTQSLPPSHQSILHAAMLKGKLKLPEKRSFPDRLGSLVAGFGDKGDAEEEYAGLRFVVEFGKELETFQPNGFASDRESPTDHNGGGGDDFVDEVDIAGAVEESGSRVRKRTDRVSACLVSVMEAISADEKRSDLEYQVRFFFFFWSLICLKE